MALDDLPESELALLALKFAAARGDIVMDEAARKVLEADEPPLSRITRRDAARVFGDDLAGEADRLEMLGHPAHLHSRAVGSLSLRLIASPRWAVV